MKTDTEKDETDKEKDETDKEKDEIAIVCVKCVKAIQGKYIVGSTVSKCSFCGADVWVSPSSKKINYNKIYCTDCWSLDFDPKEKVNYIQESVNEFNEWLKMRKGNEMQEDDILEMIKSGLERDVGIKNVKIRKIESKKEKK